MTKFPRLTVDTAKLRNNVRQINRICREKGILVAGVIKGCNALPECVREFEASGCRFIASSRIEQLEAAKASGVTSDLMMIRVPMLSEAEDIVRVCDYSLNSNLVVLAALNEAAARQDKIHNVILMADIGDLREGWWDKEAMLEAALKVEKEMSNLHLAGVGINVGCYGSLKASSDKLQEIVDIARRIEDAIGRQLEFISGGSTVCLPRVIDGDIPEGINMLRIGEGILLSEYMLEFENYEMDYMYRDVFTLEAEVIEVEDKPTHPVGEIGLCDAFGHKMEYEDRGIRRRALLALGKVDYGSLDDLLPQEKNLHIIGASSDHTIVEVDDLDGDVAVGDIMSFDLTYATLPFLTNSRNVKIEYLTRRHFVDK